jgi:Ser-tRNA(Ala) deacylase AlaX
MEQPILNEAKKQYACDMHTCEHILNQTMVRMFGCGRSFDAHIERKKSKCDYLLTQAPTEVQIIELSDKVNEIINQHLPVTVELMSREEAGKLVDMSKLPDNASETLRIVRVGDYDACACIGQHVKNTSEIGRFQILSHESANGRWRVRFKLNYL